MGQRPESGPLSRPGGKGGRGGGQEPLQEEEAPSHRTQGMSAPAASSMGSPSKEEGTERRTARHRGPVLSAVTLLHTVARLHGDHAEGSQL